MRGRGESAGADEERPHEVGGGRLSDLLAAFTDWWGRWMFQASVDIPGLLREESVQWLHFGSSQTWHE